MIIKKIHMIQTKLISKFVTLATQNYHLRALTPSQSNAALSLLSKEFQSQQPLSNAYYRTFPHSKEERLNNWNNFWKIFQGDYLTNQISVGCFDTSNGNELVGISVAKDLNYVPDGFEEKFMKKMNFILPIINLEEKMLSQVETKHQLILSQTGMVMDVWGVAIKKGHMGKRLLHKMIKLNERLGILKGYQYSFSYATNLKTGVALKKQNFEMISSFNAKQFELNGVKYFQEIDQTNKFPSLYLKKIEL